jgi:RNA polymerase sigma factor (sigma-70 family)
VDYERLVVDNLPLIDSVVRTIGRRHRLSADEQDELGASVRLKLVENDYEVLRKFEGRCQLRTYLVTVVQRHFLDARNSKWGKWRPSAQARRLGPMAVLLDQLTSRDHLSFDEAAQAVLARHADAVSLPELQNVLQQLPTRSSRRFLSEEELEHVPASGPGASANVESREHRQTGDRIERALSQTLSSLAEEDRLILKLRFCDNVKLARIAELVGAPPKAFYRRVDDLMRTLKKALEAQGVSASDVAVIIEDPAARVEDVIEPPGPGKSLERPSVP